MTTSHSFDPIVSFCLAHPANPTGAFDETTLRQILDSLVRGPEAILDLTTPDASARLVVALIELADNEAALDLYRRHGFETISTRANYRVSLV